MGRTCGIYSTVPEDAEGAKPRVPASSMRPHIVLGRYAEREERHILAFDSEVRFLLDEEWMKLDPDALPECLLSRPEGCGLMDRPCPPTQARTRDGNRGSTMTVGLRDATLVGAEARGSEKRVYSGWSVGIGRERRMVNVSAEQGGVPVESKLLLTLEEAATYTGIGVNAFREISHDPDFAEEVVCVVGKRRMFKRQCLEEYINSWAGCEL